MDTIYVASMKWAEKNEPICAGTNQQKVRKAALDLLRHYHGYGAIDRGSAFCAAKITKDDIDIDALPIVK
jgi:hypothetical protein